LLWLILRSLCVRAAWLAATVWGVHPVMVESVAWITELKNTLSAALYLATIFAYMRFDPAAFSAVGSKKGRIWAWYGCSLVLFMLALLSKTVTSSLPAVLVILMWCRRGSIRRQDLVPVLPLIAVAIPLAMMTSWMERELVGAHGKEWAFGLADRIVIAGRAVWFYIGKIVCPTRLSFNYERWNIDARSAAQWIYPVLAVVCIGMLVIGSRTRLGRRPATAALYFVGTLFPALGFVNVYPMRFAFVADHFQYLASIGPIVIVADIARRNIPGTYVRWSLCALLIFALSGLTFTRARVFKDSAALWSDTLRKNPKSWLAHSGLAGVYAMNGDVNAAVEESRMAVSILPDARNRAGLAARLAVAGDGDEARREHLSALELEPDNAILRYNYAFDLERWGELDTAEREYRKALALDERLPGVRTRLAIIRGMLGDIAGAVNLYREELRLFPESPSAAYNLANELVRAGRTEEAERHLRELLRYDPENARAHGNLGIILAQRRDVAGAEAEFGAALQYDEAIPEVHNALGALLFQKGDIDAAISHYRDALRLRPDYERARANLDAAMAMRDARRGMMPVRK
jgi:Flp pilus assembly protein TadD